MQRKSTPRPNSEIIPPPFDIKNMPNLTALSELPENQQKLIYKLQKPSNNLDYTSVKTLVLILRGTPKRNEKRPYDTHREETCFFTHGNQTCFSIALVSARRVGLHQMGCRKSTKNQGARSEPWFSPILHLVCNFEAILKGPSVSTGFVVSIGTRPTPTYSLRRDL